MSELNNSISPYYEADGKARRGNNTPNCVIDVVGLTSVGGAQTAVVEITSKGIIDGEVKAKNSRYAYWIYISFIVEGISHFTRY